MATLVSAELRSVADQVVKQCGYRSAVLSGIVPDRAHLRSGGYHCSVNDLKAHGNGGDYSNSRPDDRGHNPEYGAGIDISMGPADMVTVYKRVHQVWVDLSDPRRKYVNAINVYDGSGDATRLDFVTCKAGYANASHKWHNHLEFRRRWVRDPKAARAMVSIFKGEPKPVWVSREEPALVEKLSAGVRMLPVDGVLPELRRGIQDPVAGFNYVWRLQLLLKVTADSDYGPATEAAVRRYNRDVLKRESKIVDAAFWKRLYAIKPAPAVPAPTKP